MRDCLGRNPVQVLSIGSPNIDPVFDVFSFGSFTKSVNETMLFFKRGYPQKGIIIPYQTVMYNTIVDSIL